MHCPAVQLAKKGILEECDVEILGTRFEAIERAEDRELFKDLCLAYYSASFSIKEINLSKRYALSCGPGALSG